MSRTGRTAMHAIRIAIFTAAILAAAFSTPAPLAP
jgi:hypothetical protein